MSLPTLTLVDCPFCKADVEVTTRKPFTVGAGEACDHRPGWTDVEAGCDCPDVLQALGGSWEKYVERVVESVR